MLTEEEYKKFIRRSQEDNYFLTSDEKKRMRSYLDHHNAIRHPSTFGGGLMQLVARGPTCWNGDLQHKLYWKDGSLQWKDENGKKCWYCDLKHNYTD